MGSDAEFHSLFISSFSKTPESRLCAALGQIGAEDAAVDTADRRLCPSEGTQE